MAETYEKDYFLLPLQISSEAWRDNGLSLELLAEVPAAPLFPLRQLARLRQKRHPERPAQPARLHLLGLLNRVFRQVINSWLESRRCLFAPAGLYLNGRRLELPSLEEATAAFVEHFPPAAVLKGEKTAEFFTGGESAERRRQAAVELFVLAVQTQNPAARDLGDLFDDTALSRTCPYRRVIGRVDSLLTEDGKKGDSLLEELRAPLEASPDSLSGQLDWARRNWSHFLPPDLLTAILIAFDLVAEEEKVRRGGPGPAQIPRFAAAGREPDRFSPDRDWMPEAVLLAKTIYVWLDQLSNLYGRPIGRLDQIPDAELDRLASWGFTALWLIGVWERSAASEKIKRIMGNPEAVASAYSLFDYAIAAELGGEEALAELDERCRRRGIRLACDVVPNHTGICSRWTREHPDWYIQTEHPPYPAYSFTGPDLSSSGDMEIRIEDGYWDHSDAAVVFRHIDRRSGKVRYIYHGNDGTHLPWNDTAQLNFLLPEVREAMIRTIIEVARRFRIIRFDAAMTLAKKHFQRLWFPPPGGGGGIPSRAEHCIETEAFERVFPVEFWREVVNRVAAEVPDTLLLAEAFWLMEGYFVRTLGMHRVYNSAFMNMLKTEDNARYRSVLKNVLEFDHQILKRFVNFMNNPDEATAVAQFGKGDKYFAVAVLLVTMPGLPMFGHGQVEGLEEKYGMEYRRAYREEAPDEGFIRHHEAQIFPLLRRRHLFSDSTSFHLYDFGDDGQVNEDVFVYSNRTGEERSLVVVHNRHAETSGRILMSVGKRPHGREEEPPRRVSLGEGLGIAAQDGGLWRCREQRSGLQYLFAAWQLAGGLDLYLGPYQYSVFLDFERLPDPDGSWRSVWEKLAGRPVADLDRARHEYLAAPAVEAFRALFDAGPHAAPGPPPDEAAGPGREEEVSTDLDRKSRDFFSAAITLLGVKGNADKPVEALKREVGAWRNLTARRGGSAGERRVLDYLRRAPEKGEEVSPRPLSRSLWAWMILRHPKTWAGEEAPAAPRVRWLQEHLLDNVPAGTGDDARQEEHMLAGVLLDLRDPVLSGGRGEIAALLSEDSVRRYLGCHWYGGIEWFNRERLDELLRALFAATALRRGLRTEGDLAPVLEPLEKLLRSLEDVRRSAARAGYRVDKFLEFV